MRETPRDELEQVITCFREFNSSDLINLPLDRQFEVTLEGDTARRLLDLSLLANLSSGARTPEERQNLLDDLYRSLIEHINLLRKQKR
jgi:hypothetical protein